MLDTIGYGRRARGLAAVGCALAFVALAPAAQAVGAGEGDSCAQLVAQTLVDSGEATQAEVDAIPAAVFDALIDSQAEEVGLTREQLCIGFEAGVFDSKVPTEGRSYPSMLHLQVAATAAGLPCTDFAPGTSNSDAVEAVKCLRADGDNTMSALFRFDPALRQMFVDTEQDDPVLIGPNWLIADQNAAELQGLAKGLGGDFVPTS